MYQAQAAMTPTLHRNDYTTVEAHQSDLQRLSEGSWQLVGSSSSLLNDGDFLTTDRFGVPVLVRNFGGTIQAVRNVCAHRHCRLESAPSGQSDELKCPYHGWRYGSDGRTRKLPGVHNFPGFDRETYRLPVFETRQIGQLVFVRLQADDANPGLDDWSTWQDEFASATDDRHWRLVLDQELTYPCDWKIPIEGSLESYHLEEIHSKSLGSDPGEEHTQHDLFPSGTVFETNFRESCWLGFFEETMVRLLTGGFNPTYRHVHVFPNVMASFNNSLSLVYQIFPESVATCRIRVLGYAPRSRRWGYLGRAWSWGFGFEAARMARKVLREDAAIFTEVQHGMSGCDQTRIFGRCEERLHAFHQMWRSSQH